MTSSPSSSSILSWVYSPCSSSPPSSISLYVALSLPRLTPEGTSSKFLTPTSSELRETCKNALHDALKSVRGPFIFNLVESYTFNGAAVGVDTPSNSFNSAVITVIAAVERGYCSYRDPAPLGPSDWAKLSSALLAAVGRGYHRQYTPDQETALDRERSKAIDL